jgi:hypothetical protein
MAELDANRGDLNEAARGLEIVAHSRMSATAPPIMLAACSLLILTGMEAAAADAVITRRI